MNKKINLLGLLFFLSFLSLHAQMSYYYRGEKIQLTINRNYIHIIADNEFIKSSSANELFQRLNLELDGSKSVQDLVKLRLNSKSDMLEYSKLVELLKQNEQIKHVFPFFGRGDATPIGRTVGVNLRVHPNPEPENKINISHLPAGVYFVKITTDTGEVIKKVIKQ